MKTRFSLIGLITVVAILTPNMAQASRRAAPIIVPFFAPTATPTIDFTVNSTADEIDDNTSDAACHTSSNTCTLRAAIMQANASGGNKVISLPAGTYSLTRTGASEDSASTGDLDITSDMRIIGTGSGKVIVNGSGDRVFHIPGSATVTITNVMIQSGSLVFQGGGVYNSGTLTLVNVTVKNNSANNGGGIYNRGTLTLTNSTVSGNSTGGVESSALSTLRLNSSTIASNTSSGSNTPGVAGGITVNGTTTIKNSIIANNTVVNCVGVITTANYSFLPSGCSVSSSSNNITFGNINLAALGDNGGNTDTHALTTGSAAIDAGDPTGCSDSNGVTLETDQRAQARGNDGDGNGTARCDMGAYEGVTVNTPTPTHTPTFTPTLTLTHTPTKTFTPSITNTPTNTLTPSITPTPSLTNIPTLTLTPSLTNTPTETPSITPSPTNTLTPSLTYTPSITRTPTTSRTPTITRTLTSTRTLTPSKTPTFNGTFPTNTPTPTLTNTRSPTPSDTPTLTPTSTEPLEPVVFSTRAASSPTPTFTATTVTRPGGGLGTNMFLVVGAAVLGVLALGTIGVGFFWRPQPPAAPPES